MTISNRKANELIRESFLSDLIDYLHNGGIEDVLKVKSNEIAIPTIDCNDEEKWLVLTVKVPTGANKGTEPYDGYAEAEEYTRKLEQKKIKAQKRAEKDKRQKEKRAKEIELNKKNKGE